MIVCVRSTLQRDLSTVVLSLLMLSLTVLQVSLRHEAVAYDHHQTRALMIHHLVLLNVDTSVTNDTNMLHDLRRSVNWLQEQLLVILSLPMQYEIPSIKSLRPMTDLVDGLLLLLRLTVVGQVVQLLVNSHVKADIPGTEVVVVQQSLLHKYLSVQDYQQMDYGTILQVLLNTNNLMDHGYQVLP